MIYAGHPNDTFQYPSTMISAYSREGGVNDYGSLAAATSGVFDSVNRVHYHRIYIPSPVTIYKLFWLNGATVGTNNFQAGLYYDDGTNKPGGAAVRGTSTLSAGANACQYDNITDTTVGAGIYWIALWGSGTTATLFRRGVSNAAPGPYYIESAAGGLPTTATPLAGGATSMYFFGLVCRSTP